jgi:hypothetical protein
MPTRSRVRSGLCAGRTRARCATRQSRSRVAYSGKDIGGYPDPRNKADLNEICSCASRCAATPHAYKRKGKAMQTTAALVARDDGLIRRITLSNGACRNPLSSKLISELRSVLARSWQHTSVASDHSCSRRASASCLRSSAGYSIKEGSRFQGQTVHTILRSEFIMRDRELDDAAVGKCRYLTRRI